MLLKLPTRNHLARRPLPTTIILIIKRLNNLLVNPVIQKRDKLAMQPNKPRTPPYETLQPQRSNLQPLRRIRNHPTVKIKRRRRLLYVQGTRHRPLSPGKKRQRKKLLVNLAQMPSPAYFGNGLGFFGRT